MISSVYLGYSSNIPVMVLTAILLYGSMVLDRKYKWLRYGQFLFLGAFHLSTQLNWCVLLYYILIIHLIHRKASLKETLPISVLLVLQYSLIRQVYMPPTSYNLLVTVFDFISSLVVVFSYHFVHRLEYEKSKLWKEKQFLTFHDVLTGLLNYDGYMNKVQELVEYRTPFQLVLLDINNFKSLNGKDISTANEILISMAKAIQLRFDEHLIGASRYAGDRFAILLTEQAVIDDEKFKFDAIGVKVCYSITCYPHEASNVPGADYDGGGPDFSDASECVAKRAGRAVPYGKNEDDRRAGGRHGARDSQSAHLHQRLYPAVQNSKLQHQALVRCHYGRDYPRWGTDG